MEAIPNEDSRGSRSTHAEVTRLTFFSIVVAMVAAGCGSGSSRPGDDGAIPLDGAVEDARVHLECTGDRSCVAPSVCIADTRVPTEDLALLPLTCGAATGEGGPHAACEDGASCARGICLLAGTCVVPCEDDTECGEAERCADVFARTGASSLQPVRACVVRVHASPNVEVSQAVLSGALRGTETGDTIEVSTRAGTMLVIVEPSEEVELRLLRIVTAAPAAVTIFDSDMLAVDTVPPRNPADFTREPMTVLLPSGSRASPETAAYDLLLRSSAPSDVRLAVLSRDVLGAETLDIDVFYVGGGDLAPEGARGPPLLARALDALDATFGAVGIHVGEVRQHAVVGGLRARYEIVDRLEDVSETAALFRLSAGARGVSVPLFLVRSIEGALGVSGSTPGPAGVHGTIASGVAIPVDVLLPSESRFARALAHEVAHYMGLFHTSEPNGIVLESIGDTPECRIVRDESGDGVLSDAECVGAGAENLMFWTASGDVLSAQQGAVLRRSFLLR